MQRFPWILTCSTLIIASSHQIDSRAAVIDVFDDQALAIHAAVESASAGDTLRIHDGVYDFEETDLIISKPLTLEAVNLGGAILENGAIGPGRALIQVAADSAFRGLVLRKGDRGFYQRDTGAHGLIERSVIHDMATNGIAINNSASRSGSFEARHLTIVDVAGPIHINDGGVISLTNSIIANANIAYVAHNNIAIDVSHNLLVGVDTVSSATSLGRVGLDPNQLSYPDGGDSLFVDQQADNFFLTTDSPAIDTGLDIGFAFYGLAPDRGAFEAVPEPCAAYGVLLAVYLAGLTGQRYSRV